MAGGGSCKDSALSVASWNVSTVRNSDEDPEASARSELPHCSISEEIGSSEDEVTLVRNGAHSAGERLIEGKTETICSNSGSLLGVMNTPVLSKNLNRNLRRVSKFYLRQSSLVENFRRDSSVIEEHRRRRKITFSESLADGVESENLLVPREQADGKESIGGCQMNGEVRMPVVKIRRQSVQKSANVANSRNDRAARWLAMATLIANVTLVIAKTVAAYLSGSLSIISSLVDSAVDITSGLVIWVTARAIRKRDPYMYPRGRTRLEPIALIIVSVIMGVASIQIIVQTLESVIHNTVDPRVDVISLCIMVATIFIKFTLMFLCRKFADDPSVAVLAQDHRNDCISNTVAIACAWIAANYWLYMDPLGAILVSTYIATTWFLTGKEHLLMLSGKSAAPEFINRIVKVCVEHDKRIDYIDTVYVYHFGTRFLVEVHIVMNPNMTLRESHDISEALQTGIESLVEVERAFVHCDYEYDHLPTDEHKIV